MKKICVWCTLISETVLNSISIYSILASYYSWQLLHVYLVDNEDILICSL
jgi:hypothetical protein